ncbi:MAG: TrkA family potassium uptake protein [Eubacteriales bacterium]|nr:TrkA family potassium uptake protein [Eubacteriales bacterium]
MTRSFCIIGLGSFGSNLALTLMKNRSQVLVIDNNEDKVDALADRVTNAVCGDPTNESVLRAAGVTSYDCCVVCLSDSMENATLVTLMLKEMGIKKVVARASSDLHKKVLLKVGADMVVFPEQDMGKKLASNLTKTDVFEYINLSDKFSIMELKAPKKWIGKPITELNIRQKYGVNVIAMKDQDDNLIIFTDPNKPIKEGQVMVIIGSNSDLARIV